MTERPEFWEIVDLLGLTDLKGTGVSGSLYEEDVRAIADAIGVPYRQSRTETWKDVIVALGGVPDLESDVSSGGTIEKEGLAKVRDLLLQGSRQPEHDPTPGTVGAALEGAGAFDPDGVQDQRELVLASIARRRGQPAFRRQLLVAYESRCAVTGSGTVEALEAAHIDGYKGPDSNHVQNGLLLRADVHTLFDLGLLGVAPHTMSVWVAEAVTDEGYRALDGQALRLPVNDAHRPSVVALEQHKNRFA